MAASVASTAQLARYLRGVGDPELDPRLPAPTPTERASLFPLVYRFLALFHAGDYRAAWAAAQSARELMRAVPGLAAVPEYELYAALTLAALHDAASVTTEREVLPRLREDEARFAAWARACDANFGHKHALVAAELARLEGRGLEALQLFQQAIHGARTHGCVQYEALA
ncbi:MAG TPA: hypothetical protein VGQ83_15415 [Polyangia bacterium]|jgi:hypothetical protein